MCLFNVAIDFSPKVIKSMARLTITPILLLRMYIVICRFHIGMIVMRNWSYLGTLTKQSLSPL